MAAPGSALASSSRRALRRFLDTASAPWGALTAPLQRQGAGVADVLTPVGARAASNQIVRARMKSVNNIKKITMAMKMVAASKLRTMQVKAENSRGMWQPFTALLGDAPSIKAEKKLIVVLSSDKGLCGGINSTSVKYTRTLFKLHKLEGEGKEVKMVLIGDKGKGQLQREYNKTFSQFFTETQKEGINFTQCAMISDEIVKNNKYDVLHMVFNKFESAVSFLPTVATIFSTDMFTTEEGLKVCKMDDYEMEGDDSQSDVMMNLAEFQMAAVLYNGMLENATSEMGARMSAMDNSTRNAGDVLARLTLSYNRSRQSAITTELIEIISGAAALEG
ncbi:hypothetical protein KC19_11G112500 [Ceratodon purpureus]|uniref:F-ATPase gamma subunit n=1 Tax=Ceratodon purpureus TaxID=3225 RepID=A0A8T0GFC3_CERPU|nr:hypothetical protein KC19_11G112500 [Ceratodon purpureus]